MSADDYIVIVKDKDGKFRGYRRQAPDNERENMPEVWEVACFVADTAEEAIRVAQEIDTEYGYRFVNL